MALFEYRAADRRGQTTDGIMEAPDARAVVERLQRDAYFPIRVVPQTARRTPFVLASLPIGQRRVRSRELVSFTQQFAALLEAGLPLDRALSIQEELAPSVRLQAITHDVLQSVRGGSSLADALTRHHPRPFSRLYTNMVRAGEQGGVLEATLKRLAELLEETQEFRDTLVSALIYPSLLAAVGSAAVVFLMTFVIPRFADIFRDLGGAIPAPTQMLLAVSDWLRRFWWLLAVVGIGVVVGARGVLSTPSGRLRADRLLLQMPVVGDVILKTEVARFARVLGTLLRSGVALLTALGVVKEMMGNRLLARALDGLAEGIRRGAGLWKPMTEAGVFPPLAVHMVRVGEESGRVEEMLLRVGSTLEADTKKVLRRLVALAEPCIILVMGLVVGFIVLAMLLAIFSISEIPL